MSGTYERAGTVGFRCVADAEDTCGTDGRLCAEETTPPTKAHLSATGGLADWVLCGAIGEDALKTDREDYWERSSNAWRTCRPHDWCD